MRWASTKWTLRFSLRRVSTQFSRSPAAMKSTRIRREQATLIRLAVPSSASIFFRVGVMSPISWPGQLDAVDLDAGGLLGRLRRILEAEPFRHLADDRQRLLRGVVAGAADAHLALRRLPRRRRDLVGHAVVDRRLVELVGAIRHPQGVETELPERRVGIADAVRCRVVQHGEELLAADPAHVDRLRDPASEQIAQLGAGLDVDPFQRAPVEDPGQRHLQRPRSQRRDALGIEIVGADPADLAFDAARARPLLADRLGDQARDREPLRRRPAEALGVVERQALELVLLADRAVQVEQDEPGLRMLLAQAAGAGQVDQRLLARLEIGIGEGDDGFVELRIVNDLGRGD